ncbi:MAG: hypothetical protein NZZ41_03785 [Candidatus Dojkabacteria bacterium]|nr:hypothetical protein [Candidatus Dojkabacteria bacterium]
MVKQKVQQEDSSLHDKIGKHPKISKKRNKNGDTLRKTKNTSKIKRKKEKLENSEKKNKKQSKSIKNKSEGKLSYTMGNISVAGLNLAESDDNSLFGGRLHDIDLDQEGILSSGRVHDQLGTREDVYDDDSYNYGYTNDEYGDFLKDYDPDNPYDYDDV